MGNAAAKSDHVPGTSPGPEWLWVAREHADKGGPLEVVTDLARLKIGGGYLYRMLVYSWSAEKHEWYISHVTTTFAPEIPIINEPEEKAQ